MLNRDARARRQPRYGAVSVCVEGTAREGGWIRRRRRRATGRRRAGKRRIELSLNDHICFSDQHRKLREAFCFFWDGVEGEPIGIECQREQVRRSGASERRR